jgi:hypothetical protein
MTTEHKHSHDFLALPKSRYSEIRENQVLKFKVKVSFGI